ncbi:MAG: fused MFS/spermidine synthase [Candidatus Sumerlaeia bacterium]
MESSEKKVPRGVLPLGGIVIVFIFFLLSGMSGLIYEVIWTRVLLTIFGATLYAVSTVLAAFMGGLALGSLIGGKLADGMKRPLRFYGMLEICEGIFAISVPFMLRAGNPIYDAVYAGGESSFLKLSLIRFIISFIVLLIPTTIMGATLPVLSRFLVRKSGALGGRVGALYATNTAGAVLGTFFAGFVFIAAFGTRTTILMAGTFSILAGIGSILLSTWLEKNPRIDAEDENVPTKDEIDENPALVAEGVEPVLPAGLSRLVLITYGISGFVALSYQVFWTRALVFRFEYLKNTTYSFSAMLTVFLVGLALGSAFMSAIVDRQRHPLRLYGLVQILIGLSGALSLFMLIYRVQYVRLGEPVNLDTNEFNWILAVANVFYRTVLVIGLPTLLMGMAFPLAARLCVRDISKVGSGTGRIYAVNTIGAILGSFAAGFVLIPIFGLSRGFLVLALINVIIGSLVLILNPADNRRLKIGWSVLAFLALGIIFIKIPGQYFFQELSSPYHKIVAYEEGPLATVSVVEDSIGDRTIYVDNVGVAGTDRILLTDQKSLAHVPMLILENPKSALTVGFGSGGASWSFTLYEELEQVDCIEISRTVPEMAHTLKDSNHGVLDEWDGGELAGKRFHDGRYRVIIDDARSYLQFSDAQYDIIATDCTDLRYKSNANLYDVEYFQLCRDSLTDDGMVVVWMPLGGMSPEVFACAMKTFAHVFPDMTIWYMNNEPTHYLLLLGTKQPLRINIERMLERINRPEIQQDLAEVSLQQAEKILACYVEVATAFEEDWADAPLNTEVHPHLEFESPKFGYGEEPVLVNLEGLRKYDGKITDTDYIEDADAHPEFMKRLERFVAATEPVLKGHSFVRRLERKDARQALIQACKNYLKAHAICPEDKSVQFLLEFDTLKRRTAPGHVPQDYWALTAMGDLEFYKTQYKEAVNYYFRGLALSQQMRTRHSQNMRQLPPDSLAYAQEQGRMEQAQHFILMCLKGMIRSYKELGMTEKALDLYTKNEALLQKDPDFDAFKKTMGIE